MMLVKFYVEYIIYVLCFNMFNVTEYNLFQFGSFLRGNKNKIVNYYLDFVGFCFLVLISMLILFYNIVVLLRVLFYILVVNLFYNIDYKQVF